MVATDVHADGTNKANSAKPIVLLIDDDPDILEFLEYNLRSNDYKVHTALGGREALRLVPAVIPDLILLDMMMPEMSGIEVCEKLRSMPALNKTYIIFLTARIEDHSELAGFSAGADDYINKPIKPALLLSRMKAVLSRRQKEEEEREQVLEFGDIIINRVSYTVSYKGEELHFPRKEFELLFTLATHPEKVYTREDLLAEVWGQEVYVGDRTVDVHIRKIREKLYNDVIKTVKGVGYRFDSASV